MIQQVISIVAPLFLIIGVGYFYGARVRPEMRITNQLIMDVFMPTLILSVMIRDDFNPASYLGLMAGGALLMLSSGLLAYVLARLLGYSWRIFIPSAMFSNWANLGIPLYVLALGEAALGGGVMLVVVGNVLCFTIGTYLYSGRLSSFEVLKTPIIMAVFLGGFINVIDIEISQLVSVPITMLGQVAIPLMLFSLGVRLTKVSWVDSNMGIVMALFCPIVGVALAYSIIYFMPLSSLHQNILILFGALPPAVINFMLAEQYNAEPEKVASMVLIGNIVSVLSIPLVLFMIIA